MQQDAPPQKKISVITVVYNNHKYIERTIQSVLNQTFDSLEYIIIDGGSTDGTLEIIERYRERLSFFISEPDEGIYDAMNKGLKNATGEYVLYLNSGDSLFSFETLKKVFDLENRGDIYYGETMYVDENYSELGTRSEVTTRKLPKDLNARSFLKGMLVCHQSIIVKRQIAPEYNLDFRRSSDIDWCIKCLKKSLHTINCNCIISNYMTGGYSRQSDRKTWKERFTIMKIHFGLIPTIVSHIKIILKFLYFKFARKDNL